MRTGRAESIDLMLTHPNWSFNTIILLLTFKISQPLCLKQTTLSLNGIADSPIFRILLNSDKASLHKIHHGVSENLHFKG